MAEMLNEPDPSLPPKWDQPEEPATASSQLAQPAPLALTAPDQELIDGVRVGMSLQWGCLSVVLVVLILSIPFLTSYVVFGVPQFESTSRAASLFLLPAMLLSIPYLAWGVRSTRKAELGLREFNPTPREQTPANAAALRRSMEGLLGWIQFEVVAAVIAIALLTWQVTLRLLDAWEK